jgi:hypothetical protein
MIDTSISLSPKSASYIRFDKCVKKSFMSDIEHFETKALDGFSVKEMLTV